MTNENFLPQRVFVYGTLKKGMCRGRVIPKEYFVGEATMPGKIYDLGSFPGYRRGEGIVHGEVYRLTPSLLKVLDSIEGEGSLYNRVEVESSLGTVWTYEINRPMTTNLITSGVWTKL